MKRYVHLVLLLVWLAVIFLLSAKPAEESDKMSMGLGRFVASVFVPHFDEWSEEEQYALAARLDYPIRKLAHATEYAICAILFVCVWSDYEATAKRRLLLAFVCAACYAATDEFHQLFVPGRSGQITDVLLDSCGALAGVLLAAFILRLQSKKSAR